jgi:hypothetical protein
MREEQNLWSKRDKVSAFHKLVWAFVRDRHGTCIPACLFFPLR